MLVRNAWSSATSLGNVHGSLGFVLHRHPHEASTTTTSSSSTTVLLSRILPVILSCVLLLINGRLVDLMECGALNLPLDNCVSS